jgi:hypothetical protein
MLGSQDPSHDVWPIWGWIDHLYIQRKNVTVVIEKEMRINV